jgi:hypothetical protein
MPLEKHGKGGRCFETTRKILVETDSLTSAEIDFNIKSARGAV